MLITPFVLPVDLSAEPELPLVSTATNRTPGALLVIADHLPQQDRYRKRDVDGLPGDETFCNFLVREALRMLGVKLKRMRANEMCEYFHSTDALADEWTWVNQWVARALAATGVPVVGAWKNAAGPGHVVLLSPPRAEADRQKMMCFQAGASNFAYGTVQQAFGLDKTPLYFAHP